MKILPVKEAIDAPARLLKFTLNKNKINQAGPDPDWKPGVDQGDENNLPLGYNLLLQTDELPKVGKAFSSLRVQRNGVPAIGVTVMPLVTSIIEAGEGKWVVENDFEIWEVEEVHQ